MKGQFREVIPKMPPKETNKTPASVDIANEKMTRDLDQTLREGDERAFGNFRRRADIKSLGDEDVLSDVDEKIESARKDRTKQRDKTLRSELKRHAIFRGHFDFLHSSKSPSIGEASNWSRKPKNPDERN